MRELECCEMTTMHIRINSRITEDFDVITDKYGKKATGVVRRVRKLGLPGKEYYEVVMDKDKGKKDPMSYLLYRHEFDIITGGC